MSERLMALIGLRIMEVFFEKDNYFCGILVTGQ